MNASEYQVWRGAVLAESKCCCLCGSKYRSQVHHLDSVSFLIHKHGITVENWRQFFHVLFDVQNGVVLCYKHHNKSNGISLHSVFGRKGIERHHFLLYEQMYGNGELGN